MSLLIAPTLLDSFDWLKNCPPSWRERAYDGIKSTLGRAPFVPTPAIKAGLDFEKEVYTYANSPLRTKAGTKEFINIIDPESPMKSIAGSPYFRKMLDKVHGYSFGQSSSHKFIVDGQEYYIKNRYDAFSPTKIIDIKTTGNFRGNEQYTKKWQSKFYPYFSKICHMDFEVIEWKSVNDYGIPSGILDMHTVSLRVEDFEAVKKEIERGIREFIAYIEMDDTLSELYYTKYNRYGNIRKKG